MAWSNLSFLTDERRVVSREIGIDISQLRQDVSVVKSALKGRFMLSACELLQLFQMTD